MESNARVCNQFMCIKLGSAVKNEVGLAIICLLKKIIGYKFFYTIYAYKISDMLIII